MVMAVANLRSVIRSHNSTLIKMFNQVSHELNVRSIRSPVVSAFLSRVVIITIFHLLLVQSGVNTFPICFNIDPR